MQPRGDMLRLARQRKGLQQTEAAKLLKLEQSHLSRIENGLVEIREENLLEAAEVYGVPASFFLIPDPVLGAPVSVHPMWRRKASVTAREMDKVVAELNLRIIHLRRLLEGVELEVRNNIPKLDIEDYVYPEYVARLLRAHWKIPSGPIKNLTALVESAGVIVYYSSLGGSSVSGVTFSAPGVPSIILLNSEQPSDRLRYTLAHELAHLVMHRFPSPDMEREANQFAAAFLMPDEDIKPYFLGRRVDLALLAALKPEWKVAMQALLMRAASLECITQNQSQYLWKQINVRRLRLREPPELDFPREEPEVINRILCAHTGALGYSIDELAKLLHLHGEELKSLYIFDDPTPDRPRLTIVK